ncbi:MAG: AgmX/PglI C-terminal domain-containing protein [Myxococcota bacterium]
MSRASFVLASVALTSLVCLPSCDSASSSADGTPAKSEGSHAAAPPKISDQCDAAKIVSLGKTLTAATVPERPELVAKHLPDACKLPEPVTSFLTATAPLHAAAPLARGGIPPKTYRAALDAVCPAADVVMQQVGQAEAEDRPGLMFDGCKFERIGLLSRAEFIRQDVTAPIVLHAHQWLLAQGLTKEQAEPISHALLLHGRRRWAKPGQELPTLAHAVAPVPEGPTLYVTDKAVFFNDHKLVELDDTMSPDPTALQGHLIGPVYDVLAEEADKAKAIHEAKEGDSDWEARLVLVADARVPFSTMVSVLYTAGRAEYSRYAVVAESGPLEYGAVPVEPPKFSAPGKPDEKPIPALGVGITDAGYEVRVSGGDAEAEPEKIGLVEGSKWDVAALGTRASKHRTEHKTATRAFIGPADTVAWGVVVQSMAALRGAGCDTKPTDCALPDVVIGAGGSGAVPMMARNFDPDMMAANAKILGQLSQESGHFLASPYGGAFAVGNDDEDVWGGLTGTEVGEAFGAGGLGLVGTGRGGAGTGEGTIGLGNTGLIGKGGGGGTGSGYGRGSGAGFGGRGKRVPRVRQAKAKVEGKLDKDIVRRIVRAHINEVRHCYNQGLVRDPKLEGRVTIDFTIGATGKVTASSVDKSTVGDENVDKCIAKAVKRWKFPKPSDGNDVEVAYPFVLSPG